MALEKVFGQVMPNFGTYVVLLGTIGHRHLATHPWPPSVARPGVIC